jgi:hypothetical protein
MAEQTADDIRVDTVMQRLEGDLVDADGRPAEPEEVERVVREKAKSLADAPLQEFLTLLIEHQARDELRERGLHRNLGPTEEEAQRHDSE